MGASITGFVRRPSGLSTKCKFDSLSKIETSESRKTIMTGKKYVRRHGASTESRAHPPFLRRTYMTPSYIVVEGWGLKPLRTRRKSLTL